MLKTFIFLSVLLGADQSVGYEDDKSVETQIERAARTYRIQTYETYRTAREIYDRRRAAGDQLMQAWKDAGKPADHHGQIVQWFQAASHTHLGLPAMPSLPEPQESLVEQTDQADETYTAFPSLPAIEDPQFEMESVRNSDQPAEQSEPLSSELEGPGLNVEPVGEKSIFESLGRAILKASQSTARP